VAAASAACEIGVEAIADPDIKPATAIICSNLALMKGFMRFPVGDANCAQAKLITVFIEGV
jgi:hypothetical protein